MLGTSRYALFQNATEPLPMGVVVEAISCIPSLTAVDARLLARQSYGILIDQLPLEQAEAVRDSLTAQGHEVEIVEQAVLHLPTPQMVRRAECTADALVTYDLYGRPTQTAWSKVLVVSAGCYPEGSSVKVQDAEFVKSRADVGPTFLPAVYEYQESDQLVLQAITDAGTRYRMLSDSFDYSYLGERRQGTSGKNFAELVSDVVSHAGQAKLNAGAQAVDQDMSKTARYASERLFDREAHWLLWRNGGVRSKPGAADAATTTDWRDLPAITRSAPDSNEILQRQKLALERTLDETRQLDKVLACAAGALAAFYVDWEFEIAGPARWIAIVVALAIAIPAAHASIRAGRRRQHWVG